MASISRQPKEMQERHRRILGNMLKLAENRECADCRARNPTWASTNLGVFLCIRCSGLHRQVGVHITKVKSCTMDLWDPEQVAHIQRIGNAKGRKIYEAKLPPHYGKPSETEDSQLVLQWIRAKYEKKKFIADNPQAIIDAGSPVGATPTSTTSANAGGDGRVLPGHGRRRRQEQQQQQSSQQASPAPAPAEAAWGNTDGGDAWGAGSGNGDQPASAFGFLNAGSSSDGTASPAFGVQPGSAFGFVASPVGTTPPGGFDSYSGASPVPEAESAAPAERREDTLDFSYVGGATKTTAQPQSPAADFDPFAVVDSAAQQPPQQPQAFAPMQGTMPTITPPSAFNVGSPAGGEPQPSASPFTPASPPTSPATAADFAAQMAAMQAQLAQQQAFLDQLQQQQQAAGGVAGSSISPSTATAPPSSQASPTWA